MSPFDDHYPCAGTIRRRVQAALDAGHLDALRDEHVQLRRAYHAWIEEFATLSGRVRPTCVQRRRRTHLQTLTRPAYGGLQDLERALEALGAWRDPEPDSGCTG